MDIIIVRVLTRRESVKVDDDIVIWIKTQIDGTKLGVIGHKGRGHGWPVCGEGDTENYCKAMAEDLNIPFLGIFEFRERPK